ncbi:SDR family NAD(P)-dependent oxidoreductase [Mesorhizobium argentiipisi]|uniref:SDR family NAD(P)-dependent oxidoreductase n=1 Tax=Mesorhizobium argentiipisi TaxID=3015175 RepID=A0ABU8K9W4_9HYPH
MSGQAVAAAGKKFLVVGASRGIGLGLVKVLAAQGRQVVATSRDGSAHAPLSPWLGLDITDSASRERFVSDPLLDGTTHIVISAGIMPKDVDNTLDPAVVAAVFDTNSVAPAVLADMLARRLGPSLGHIMLLGSRMGSVRLNAQGDEWIYRASKAALNSAAKSFYGRRSRGTFAVTVAHPGWVRTEMGGTDADIDVATSVLGLVALLDDGSGASAFRYCDYKGESLPY